MPTPPIPGDMPTGAKVHFEGRSWDLKGRYRGRDEDGMFRWAFYLHPKYGTDPGPIVEAGPDGPRGLSFSYETVPGRTAAAVAMVRLPDGQTQVMADPGPGDGNIPDGVFRNR